MRRQREELTNVKFALSMHLLQTSRGLQAPTFDRLVPDLNESSFYHIRRMYRRGVWLNNKSWQHIGGDVCQFIIPSLFGLALRRNPRLGLI